MIERARRPWVVVLALAVVALAVVNVGVFAQENREVDYSHLFATPLPYCDGDSGLGTPPAEASSADSSPTALRDGDFLIDAVPASFYQPYDGLPAPLRLYTIRISSDDALLSDIGSAQCAEGWSIIYVVEGEVEFTHHADASGRTGQDYVGIVSYSASPNVTARPLDAGAAPVVLRPGDSIFLDQALVSYRPVGSTDVLMVVAGVSPEYLPCNGGGCN